MREVGLATALMVAGMAARVKTVHVALAAEKFDESGYLLPPPSSKPPPCSTDTDCSLNGVCTNQRCACDLPWGGESCGVLLFFPLPRPSAAYGYQPNVTSWGGNAVYGGTAAPAAAAGVGGRGGLHSGAAGQSGADGKWHLFVSEIAGTHCGLTKWNSNSRVVHAEAEAIEGPYQFADVALSVEAHNPQVIRWDGEWLLFHIGDGDSTRPVHNCTTAEPWVASAGVAVATATATATAAVHRSSSLRGPWIRANTTLPTCVNPAPWALENGSLAVVCAGSNLQNRSWRLLVSGSDGLEGSWSEREIFAGVSPPTVRPHKFWEDPMFWVDPRGRWHILAHCYVPHYSEANDYVAGHLFSADGLEWSESPVEPYRHAVEYSDGSVQNFSTLERPKLAFAAGGRPTHLFNGVSPQWPCGPCGGCTSCKVTPGTDWTYTLVRRLSVGAA